VTRLFTHSHTEIDITYFSAGFFRNTDARDFSISYHNVTLMNTSNQDSLEMMQRFRTVRRNNNWLRCEGLVYILLF